MRYASLGKRDANERPIFDALAAAGCKPVRGTDCDIFCISRTDLRGMLIEIKVPGQTRSLTKLQIGLREIFQDRYAVVDSVDSALAAVGVAHTEGRK